MQHNIQINGEKIQLVPLDESYIETVRLWRNKDNIRRWFINTTLITIEQQQAWYKKYIDENGNYVFIIVEKNSGNAVGMLSLYNFTKANTQAEFGRFLIGEDSARGKHYGLDAIRLICEYAKVNMGISKLVLEVFSDNEAAYALYKKCGFSVQGEKIQNNRKMIIMEKCLNEDS